MNHSSAVISVFAFWLSLAHCPGVQANPPKVKVFILAGQSNMEGYGMLRSLEQLGKHPKYGDLIARLKSVDGSWAERDDVTVYWNQDGRKPKHGPLNTTWGAMTGESIGPELMFGTIMGDHFDEHVLLIKTAWGGKSVWCDFRSPSAGEMTWEEKRILQRDDWLQPGRFYHQMVRDINHCLDNIDDVVPGYDGQGFEIVGLAWFQGWNDFCEWHLQLDDKPVGEALIERYPHNLSAMIRDLRKELKSPELPVVIGELGVFGHAAALRARDEDDHEARAMVKFREAQRAVVDDLSLKNVSFVSTADFWDTRLQELRVMADQYWQVKQENKVQDTDDNVLPTKQLNDEYWRLGGHWVCHYNGSATTYCLIGRSLAETILANNRGSNENRRPVRRTQDGCLDVVPKIDNPGTSAEGRDAPLLQLKVDFVPPSSQTNPEAIPRVDDHHAAPANVTTSGLIVAVATWSSTPLSSFSYRGIDG